MDCILALRVLSERLREYDEAVLAAYIDFKKAFDPVSRDVLWRLLELRGIPPRLVRLISALYTGTESAVKCDAATSDFFPVKTAPSLFSTCMDWIMDRAVTPSLFSTCMDWIMDRAVGGSGCGVSFGEVRITDLDFADDAVIFAETLDVLYSLFTHDCVTQFFNNFMMKFADDTTLGGLIKNDESVYREEVNLLVNWCSENNLLLNVDKTKEVVIDFRKSPTEIAPLVINGSEVGIVQSFKFLGITISSDLKWAANVDKIVKKAQKRTFFLRRLKSFRVG